MSRAAAIALTVCTALSACNQRVEPMKLKRPASLAPGTDGRAVLWITPRPAHPLGALDRDDNRLVTEIEELDGAAGASIATLRSHLSNTSARIRQAAVIALAAATHADAPMAVLAAVHDPHPVVRAEARQTVAELSPVIRDQLFTRSLSGDDAAIAAGAAASWPELLRPLEAPARAQRLHGALTQTANPVVVALMLAGQCGREPVPELLELAAGNDDPVVRAAAEACRIEALQPGGVADPVEIIAALGAPGPGSKGLAARLVSTIADRVAPESRERLLAALSAAAGSSDTRTAIAVSTAFVTLGAPAGVDALAVWVRAGSTDARVEALNVLRVAGHRTGRVVGATIVGALEPAYSDADATVRAIAAEVAGLTADGRVAAPLSQLMSDPVSDVRAAAAYAIGVADAKLAVAVLAESGIADTDEAVQDMSFASLHKLVHGHSMPPRELVAEWLSEPTQPSEKPFWGRDFERWRRWYQVER